mmetsp:Transcript_26578/g.19916  ORF Transcript_26578/g.19916 Transcript_26578/m.19916 type:complete len:92 (+) Transcript_26578:189-464(+)|eukprot:CAMPEP_0202970036 /NCGR_PEP_ID=MMETSP1396-20130829/15985_1 /ASSEMBLY_ACC=CAM_ASM_000872 /TAXON_ID= /ORGANISM="Pseudokeronopsis sp., Strain Brazil" /LENGTH=91 /DNA_ID=CAMNT_0049698257 /DNA_START=732 /DNA_END=1007 /DNA_ORIENTATION=+
MVSVLFLILKSPLPSPANSLIKARASSCLAEIANVRQSLFTSPETRVEFVKHFSENMIQLLQSGAKKNYLLKDRQVYKEFVKVPYKFESNF